ncbi:MAG TPA: hypothetical protein VGK56_11305 [Anaerolineales bacterium]
MFEDDSLPRTTMRAFLALQIAALGIVLGLRFAHLVLPALAISSLTLLVFVAILLRLYARYRKLPIVREKKVVQNLVPKFEKKLQEQSETIRAAISERQRLFRAEKQEIHAALRGLQTSHMEEGLAAASVRAAAIPGITPRLKDRLIEHGIGSAADVNDTLPELAEFGEAERQSVLEWRNAVLAGLESTRPDGVPHEKREAIGQKYRALHDQNNVAERRALASIQVLEYELITLRPELQFLERVTFMGYVSKSLASRTLAAAVIALLLIGAQIVSSLSATASFKVFLP